MAIRPGRSLLRYYRKRKKWTQMKLALNTGVSQSYISRVERGLEVVSYGFALQAAKKLGCRMEDLHAHINYFLATEDEDDDE